MFHAHSRTYYGSWMRDPKPKTNEDSKKRWLTHHFYGNVLHEYANEAELRREKPLRKYYLPFVYDGTNHVVYDGHFYYHRAGSAKVGKFELNTANYTEVTILGAAHRSDNYLYNLSYNYLDLSLDENALWVLFHYQDSPYLSISQIALRNFSVVQTWNLTDVNHTSVANSFVVCGVLYVVKSSHDLESKIEYIYDLFRSKQVTNVKLPWVNLYRNSNMITYNSLDKRIYVYDHGYLLAIPAKIHDKKHLI